MIATDGAQRLPAAALRRAVEEDAAAGLRPFCAVATAGTTSTGAVDPLREIAAVCEAHGLWLHVDGAYGAPAVLTEPGRAVLDGIELADSLVVDPHKWLFQPYEIGCVLVREPGLLERVFSLDGDYLRDVRGGAVNFRDRGPELTRGARALKLWLSVRVFGLDAFRAAIAHGIALAEHAESRLRERAGLGGRERRAARDRHLPPRRARRRGPHAAGGRDGRRRLRRAEHDGRRRPGRPAAVHDQPAHDVRGRRRDARAHGGAGYAVTASAAGASASGPISATDAAAREARA